MDAPIWVTVLAAVLTAVGAYAGGIRPARLAAAQAEADRDLARQERDDQREQWLVERVDRAWELCRSTDEREKRAGVRLLRALIKEPALTRRVSDVLDEVVQEELGDELRDLRVAWQRTGSLPDVDIVVMDGDDDGEGEVDDEQAHDTGPRDPPPGRARPGQGRSGPRPAPPP